MENQTTNRNHLKKERIKRFFHYSAFYAAFSTFVATMIIAPLYARRMSILQDKYGEIHAQAFPFIDANHDGRLSPSEIGKAYEKMDIHVYRGALRRPTYKELEKYVQKERNQEALFKLLEQF